METETDRNSFIDGLFSFESLPHTSIRSANSSSAMYNNPHPPHSPVPATNTPQSHTTRQLEQYSLFEKDKLCVAIALPSYTYMLLNKAKCINENLQVIYCDTFAYNYFIHLKTHYIMVCLNGLHLCAHSHERFTKYLVINYFSNYFEDNKQNKKGIKFYREKEWGWD